MEKGDSTRAPSTQGKGDLDTDIEDTKPNMKVFGRKWVFALKRNEFGEVEKFKARLVALGYRQKYAVDYTAFMRQLQT